MVYEMLSYYDFINLQYEFQFDFRKPVVSPPPFKLKLRISKFDNFGIFNTPL